MIPGTRYSLFLILDLFPNIYIFCVNFYQYFIVEIKFLNLSHYFHTSLLEITTLKSDLSFI